MKERRQTMFQKTHLGNGITVISERMPHVRSLCIGLWVPTGSRDEIPEENGISHFVEHMLFKGTPGRTALDIATAVDSLGGEINAFTSREYTTYYIKVLDAHLAVAMDVLSDIFLHSLFDPEELEKERQVILEEIRMQEDQPEDHVHDLIQNVIWADQPLGSPVAGRAETVSALDRRRIVDFVERRYRRPGLVISCAGNVEHEACVRAAREGFQGFSTLEADVRADTPHYCTDSRVLTKDLEQVHLCLTLPGLSQTDPDRYAFYALNTILGTNMSSRLFQEVREKRGMAYSIFSYLSSYRDAGNITVYTGASREKIKEVVEIVTKEISRLSREPVAAAELHKAKEYMKGGLVLSLESSSSVMSRIAKQEIYFREYQGIEEIITMIEGVGPEKVLETAARNLDADRLSLAAIGPIEREDLCP